MPESYRTIPHASTDCPLTFGVIAHTIPTMPTDRPRLVLNETEAAILDEAAEAVHMTRTAFVRHHVMRAAEAALTPERVAAIKAKEQR